MTARDIRYQAAVVDVGQLLLLHCVRAALRGGAPG